jgi:hypothetical protein
MRQWWLGLVVGAIIGGATGAGVVVLMQPRVTTAAPEEQRQQINDLVVKRLQLVDDSGATRATLGMNDGSSEFVLLDPSGKARLELSALSDAGRLVLADGEAPPGVILTTRAGIPTVSIAGPVAVGETRSRQLIGLAITEAGPGMIVEDGAARATMAVRTGTGGGPTLMIEDGTGKVVWSAP